MMRFLIDANLPWRVSVWQGEGFLFVNEIDEEWTDSEIWRYAQRDNHTIVTKDSDFSNRIIISKPPPRVIHLRIGNMRLSEFASFIEINWPTIKNASANHKLVNVYFDRIETVE